MSWSEPIAEGVRVLDDIDTWVIQIAKKPEVTKDGHKPDLTYTFVKLDRGTEDAGLRKKIVRDKCPDYIVLWNKAREAWLVERDLYDSDGTNIREITLRVTQHCLDFIMLRREFRDELDMGLRFNKELYKTCCQCVDQFMALRSALRYLERTPDADVRDGLWELFKSLNGYNPVQAPEDIAVVICTVGAVCPRAYERKNKGGCQKFVDEVYFPDEHPKPEKHSQEWLDIVLSQMISYGAYANLEEECFLHEDDAIPWAQRRLGAMAVMLGFALDRACNAIGSTGWDFLSGDITAGLRRKAPKGKELEQELVRKISGLAEIPRTPESEYEH